MFGLVAEMLADIEHYLTERKLRHPPCRLRDQPAEAQARRGAVRLGKTIGGLARPMCAASKSSTSSSSGLWPLTIS